MNEENINPESGFDSSFNPILGPDQPEAPKPRRGIRLILWSVFVLGLFGIIGILGLYFYVAPGLPSIEGLKDVKFQEPLRVYTADGKLIAEYGETKRIPLGIAEIPKILKDAFIAAEDDRFWEHPGIDYHGLLRAVIKLVLTGSKSQGGSTITMQVARNFFLSPEKTFTRKISEILLALQIEKELSKEQILELYLNKIYLGKRSNGVGSAAQIYYAKTVAELSLAESAMIAGLPKAPSKFNPLANPKLAVERRTYVLGRMLELDMIAETEYKEAVSAPLTTNTTEAAGEVEAPYVGEMIRSFVVERYGEEKAYTAGLKVYTTLESGLQVAANMAVRNGLLDYEKRHGYKAAVAKLKNTKGYGLLKVPAQASGGQVIQSALDATQKRGLLHALLLGESNSDLQQLQAELDGHLEEFGTLADLEIAVVTNLEEQAAHIYLGQGVVALVDWEGLSWAAPFLDTNSKGKRPARAADILQPGDIVWTRKKAEGSYELAQAPDVEGAFVSLNPDNGAVLALVGGYDFFRSGFNRVTQAERQPGSSFKPFVYAAALENGFTAASIFNDAPVVFDDPTLEGQWRPENYSGKFYGPTTLREGLVESRNLVSVRLLIELGIGKARQYAKRFGFPESALPRDLSLVLGSGTLTPLQLVSGYAAFANGGYAVKPFLIDRIENSKGQDVYFSDYQYACDACMEKLGSPDVVTEGDTSKVEPPQVESDPEKEAQAAVVNSRDDNESIARRSRELKQDVTDERADLPLRKPAPRIIEPRVAYIMNSIMQDVIRRGTATRARSLGRNDLAGKTGSTNDSVDGWFCGFNRRIVATSWIGYDNHKTLGHDELGGQSALPIWIDFMRTALGHRPEETLKQPDGVTTVRIDPATGLLANSSTANAIFEIFTNETVPVRDSSLSDSPYETQDSGASKNQEEDIF